MKQIFYPRLSKIDLGGLRIGGPGLANCMFFVSKAYIDAKHNNGVFIRPSWMKFSIGPYLRKEKDKRVYSKIFKRSGVGGLKKLYYLVTAKLFNKLNTYGPYDMSGYFTTLNNCPDLIKGYFREIENERTLSAVKPISFYSDKIAIHVRMGDYPESYRVPLSWYCKAIKAVQSINPSQQFILFSDGNDEELHEILIIEGVKRVFYGNAYADMKAISYCKLLFASDSTFSAWGAFLGDVPIVFAKRHFPSVYNGRIPEYIVNLYGLDEFFKYYGPKLLNL